MSSPQGFATKTLSSIYDGLLNNEDLAVEITLSTGHGTVIGQVTEVGVDYVMVTDKQDRMIVVARSHIVWFWTVPR